MRYIDDISYRPWSIVDFRKYQQYLEMRKERDKFLKSLREMSYIDWKIDKTLIEAGGLGKTVYILPARGGGTSFRTLQKINDFLEEGREVKVFKPAKISKDIIEFDSWKDIRDALCGYLDECIYEEFRKQLIQEYIATLDPVYKSEFKINTWPDAYAYNTYGGYLNQWRLLNEFGYVYRAPEGET